MGLIDDQGRCAPRRVNRRKWADNRRHFGDTNPEETRTDAQLVWGHQTGNVVLGPIGARFGQMAHEKAAAVLDFIQQTDFAKTIMWRHQSALRLLCSSDSVPDSGGDGNSLAHFCNNRGASNYLSVIDQSGVNDYQRSRRGMSFASRSG